MKKQIITTQEELDSLDVNSELEIIITGGTLDSPIILNKPYPNSVVILSGFAIVIMRENSQVNLMRGNSQVNLMWGNSQVKEMRGNSQVNLMWESSQVKEMWENSQVKEMWGDSQVKEMQEFSQVNLMWGNSQVKEMWENSQVNLMRGNSQVNLMRGNSQVNLMQENSQVKEMWGDSQVKEMQEFSQVKEMRGNSQVNLMRENSQVKEMWGNSTTRCLSSNNKINCFGYNYVFVLEGLDISNIILNETSQILKFNNFSTKPDIKFYLKNYPIKKKDNNTLLMYKAVHKVGGSYQSDYNRGFCYSLGETKIHDIDDQNENSCSIGLHISDLLFAVNFGRGWSDLAILECEVPINKIIVSKDCNGKVRTSELKVVRELDKSEHEHCL